MLMNSIHKIVATCVACVGATFAAPAIWNGTADVSWYESSAQAYNLTTAEQLAGLAKLVNQGTSSFEGKTITLGMDIFLNDTTGAGSGAWASIPRTQWTPIGTSSRPFKGEFDGLAGKKVRKIYGLYINDASKDYAGLFGNTSNVKISNLDVLVGQITAHDNVGGLVGYATGGSITNVHAEIKVTGNNHTGGLAGYTTGTISASSVKENVVGQDSVGGLVGVTTTTILGTSKGNSYFIGNVTGRKYVGGLAGSGESISKSYVEGFVTGNSIYVGGVIGYASGMIDSTYHFGGDVNGYDYVGGIAGYVRSIADSVYHTDGGINGRNYVGGLVGKSDSAVTRSHSLGQVKGKKYVGGLVGLGESISKGYVEGSVAGDSSYVGGVIGYASGAIDSTYHASGDVSGYDYVGGIAGYVTSLIDSTYHTDGDVNGRNYVGGLIGKGDSTIMRSHSFGRVIGEKYVGGLVGSGKDITSCYVWGTVTGDSSFVGGVAGSVSKRIVSSYHGDGNVSGFDYVGGVVGYTSYAVLSVYHTDGDVSGRNYVGGLVGSGVNVLKSYAKGLVKGDSSYVGGVVGSASRILFSNHSDGDVSGYDYVGGIAGFVTSIVDSAYHTDGNINGRNYVGGLIGKSDSTITNSHSVGRVKGMGAVGGVAGRAKSIVSAYHVSGDVIGLDGVGGVAGYVTSIVDSTYHTDGNISGRYYVGGLVGQSSSIIKNSYSEGNVSAVQSVGGVVGYLYGSIDSSYHKSGDISGDGTVGGLAGRVLSVNDNSFVMNSYSEGNVTATGSDVGGLIGLAYGVNGNCLYMLFNSFSVGNVKGNNYVGGLIGRDSIETRYLGRTIPGLTIKKSYSQGRVEGAAYVGGLVGKSLYTLNLDGDNDYSFKGTITESYHSDGDVIGKSNYVGGLAGYFVGSVELSYHIRGKVEGADYVGGLIGQAIQFKNTTETCAKDTSYINRSYSIGDVNGSKYVGGLIGADSIHKFLKKNVSNSCSSSGYGEIVRIVTESSSKGTVNGYAYVGGLIGSQKRGSDSAQYAGGVYLSFITRLSSHSEGGVVADSSCVGGLIGNASGQIDSAYHVGGDISGKSHVGGLVGFGNSLASLSNSYTEGRVDGHKGSFYAGQYVGGVVGFCSGGIKMARHTGGDVSGSSYVGGVAGRAGGRVLNSYSEGNVEGTFDYVGGLTGSSSKIRNSYAKASYVRGRNHVGGLSGYVTDSIDVSYFEGDSVTGIYQVGGLAGYAKSAVDSSYSTAHVKGDDNVGGLIGSAYGDVSNSYALGNVVGDVDNSSAGNDNLGGLVGYQYNGSISKSLALGSVSGTTKLGGLAGRFDGTTISQSYANGDVTGSYYGDPADEVGNNYIGGLVGYAKGTLEETYASGVVKGMEDEPVYTGCIVGYVNSSLNITKSYYDKTKCSLGVDGGEETATVTGSPDKTTTEMQTQSTFINWDFVDTWKIYENTYPFLKIFTNSLTNAVVTTASLENIVYDGSAKTPIVTSVELFGETLTYGSDYTVAYKNNVDAGTATINVCGVNPYGGCKAINFVINAAAIVPTIASIEDVTYSGVALTPEISVYNGGTLLTDADYTVEYADNLNAGTASVTVTLKGNYSGSATKTFTIKKATPVITQNPTASNVVNGQTLASSELTGGSADVEGAFVWQAPETVPTLENDGYIAVFVPTDELNYNSVEVTVPVEVLDYVYAAVHIGNETLDSVVVIKGGNYTLPNVPDSVGYDFVGLYKGNAIVGNPGDVIVLNENTVIEAIYEAKTFAITFVNGDVVLQSENTTYGTLPEYRGETPAKTATVQYTYTFKGWNPAIASVTGAATYTAVFDSTVNKYMVTFKDGETVLQSGEVAYGTVPTAPAVTLPENTAQYTYSFGGWDSEVVAVTGPATYTAVINRTLNKYEVVFKDYEGSVLKSAVEYDYGTSAASIAKPANPTRGSTAQYTYTFKGWNPSIADVTGAAVYTAEYDSTVRSYEIAFVNGNSTLQTGTVEYGQIPVYSGEAPTRTATAQYTYTFKGWSPAIASVTGAATYTAVFDSTVNKYTVTFKNGEAVLQSGEVAYGTVPTAPAVTLPENTAKYTYIFKGWSPAITSVTGAATYTAVIDSTVNKCTITFKDGETVLQSGEVAYGTMPTVPAVALPENTAKYTYTFKGWSPAITSVTGAATYTAVIDSTLNKYTVTFKEGATVLQSSEVAYGAMPSLPKVTLPENTAQYTYSFSWDKEIVSVTGPATYNVVVNRDISRYAVMFRDFDGMLLGSALYDYGTSSADIEVPKDPTRANSAEYTYTFKGWNPKITDVTGEAVYIAKYDSTKISATIDSTDDGGDMPSITRNEILNNDLRIVSVSRNVQIAGAKVGSVYAILDMQGRVLKKGRVESANFSIPIAMAGNYLVRIGNRTQRISIK